MRTFHKIGFTLAELLVVVVVLAVLAGVAIPKFTRVLETRKTTEAEQMLAAVRMEQEKRCTMGKQYTVSTGDISTLAAAGSSANYAYSLGNQGAEATSKDEDNSYSLKMLSYQDGRICCDGPYCESLNKNYVSCASLRNELVALAQTDECAIENENNGHEDDNDPNDDVHDCNEDPSACGCSATERWDGSKCVSCKTGEIRVGNECKKTCIESVDEQGSLEGTPVSSQDTCDGNINSKFDCTSTSKGTCTDIYSYSVALFSSFSNNPFSDLVDNNMLLADAGHGMCGQGYQCDRKKLQDGTYSYKCCTTSSCGGRCAWTMYEMQPIDDEGGTTGPIEHHECLLPKTWNEATKTCVCPNICQIGQQQNIDTCECTGGASHSTQYFKRTVTCCGGTGPVIDPGIEIDPPSHACITIACVPPQTQNPETCQCECSHRVSCSGAQSWNETTCSCEGTEIIGPGQPCICEEGKFCPCIADLKLNDDVNHNIEP